MIICHSEPTHYLARFSNGIHTGLADATLNNGGSNAAFRPHDLLEAGIAASLNMWMRIQADHLGYPLEAVSTRVMVDRNNPDKTTFRLVIELMGDDLTESQRSELLDFAHVSPLLQTLSKPIQFEHVEHL